MGRRNRVQQASTLVCQSDTGCVLSISRFSTRPPTFPPNPKKQRYKGRPHWGKNHERTYTHPACSVPDLFPKFNELLALQARLDPKRVFEPPLFAKMRARAPPRYGPRCALSGECFCQEDAHCGPGRACVASAAFPEYKGCRRVGAS